MATMNLFELLGGDDAEDPSQLVAASLKVEKTKKAPAGAQAPVAAQAKSGAKFPTKPLPPAQAVKEARSDTGRGGYGGGRGGRGYGGRGGGGFNRDSGNNENTYGNNGYSGGYRASEDGEGKTSERRGGYGGPRGGGIRGGRRGGFGDSEGGEGERPRRTYERRSGTGRGNEFKREGAGRGNWGTPEDELAPEVVEAATEVEKTVVVEKQPGEEDAVDIKEAPAAEAEEREPEEEKEMTLEEYEKVLEEKRKALQALKTEERKVNVDKEFESMQQLSSKKSGGDEIFIKLGSEKDKRKEASDKEEKAKKSVSITEFLKPAEGERYYGGRGRGRGRGPHPRGGFNQGGGYEASRTAAAPPIQDTQHFPSLGGK